MLCSVPRLSWVLRLAWGFLCKGFSGLSGQVGAKQLGLGTQTKGIGCCRRRSTLAVGISRGTMTIMGFWAVPSGSPQG